MSSPPVVYVVTGIYIGITLTIVLGWIAYHYIANREKNPYAFKKIK